MALSANTPRVYGLGDDNEFGVAASATIYEGSAVGNTSGYARALTAGDIFLGFALAKAVGNATNGGVNVRVRSRGYIQLAVASVAITDIGQAVYASDDGTFTLAPGSAEANTFVGTVFRFVSSGIAIVRFDAGGAAGAVIGGLTDQTGGTAHATNVVNLADGTTYANDHAALENNLATLTAKINEIVNVLGRF